MKSSISGRRGLGRIRLACFVRLPVSLALLHGLVACPLLVDCVLPDGTTRIELIGQDPCRHVRKAGLPGVLRDLCPAGLSAADYGNPCTDLAMENLGTPQKSANLKSLPVLSTGTPAGPASAGAGLTSAMHPGTIFKPARDPSGATGRGDPLTFSLRI